jgi:hypothetical protein
MTHQVTLGAIVVTQASRHTLNRDDVLGAILRHQCGDWGEVCPADREGNEEAMREAFQLHSVYRDRHGTPFWIITEADRSVTTVLLPDDY